MAAASGVPVEAQVQNAVMSQFLHAVERGTNGGQRERVLRGGAACAVPAVTAGRDGRGGP